MDKEKSIRDLLQQLVDNSGQLEKEKKVKKFSMPWNIRLFGKGALKRNYVIVCYINDNKNVQFMKVPISESAMMIKDSPYVAMAEHMLTYNNKPMLIVPSWNTTPFSPKENLDEAEKERTLNLGYRILLNKMKTEVTLAKKKMSWLVILIGLAAVGALIWLLTNAPKGGIKLL